MGKSVNKTILLGNVGQDPQIRSTVSGTLVATFSLATTERQKDAQGNWTDFTEWHSLAAFGRTAEIVRDYVKKGSKLYVEGKLQTRSWEKDGQKHYRTSIIVFDLSLLTPQQQGSGQSSRSGAPMADNNYGYGNSTTQPEITDDDIPF